MVKAIKLLALDIDGVLTEGRTRLGGRGPEKKRLAFPDLDAINAAKRAGLQVALVTGERDGSVDLVAARTGVALVRRGAKDKLAALQALARAQQISLAEICYVGDGDRDAPALAKAGFSLAPANATFAARSAAHRLLDRSGGHGAVAEAVRLLLRLNAERPREIIFQREVQRILMKIKAVKKREMKKSAAEAFQIANELVRALGTGRKVLLCGAGPVTALAGHLAGWTKPEGKCWPVMSLPDDAALSRRIEVWARPGDVVVEFCENSRRPRKTAPLAKAARQGAVAISFTDAKGGAGLPRGAICCRAPMTVPQSVQEYQWAVWWAVCDLVKRHLRKIEA